MELTQELLKKRYYYENGHLYHQRSAGRARVGNRAGCVNNLGYIVIQINKKQYREHRLIFLYHWGYLPKEIDHINHCGSDNRIENLREATHSQNRANSKLRGGCSSRFKGVSLHSGKCCKKRWRVLISINKSQKHLGCFYTEEEAARAYDEAAIKEFGEFAHTNKDAGLL